jgi:hypothetical protein
MRSPVRFDFKESPTPETKKQQVLSEIVSVSEKKALSELSKQEGISNSLSPKHTEEM